MTIEPKKILFAFPYFFLFIFSLWVSVSPSVSLSSFSFSLIPFPSSRKIVLETAGNSTADTPRSDESSLWADEKDDEAMASNWKRQQHENHVFYGAILTPRVSPFPLVRKRSPLNTALCMSPWMRPTSSLAAARRGLRRGTRSQRHQRVSLCSVFANGVGGVRDPRWI